MLYMRVFNNKTKRYQLRRVHFVESFDNGMTIVKYVNKNKTFTVMTDDLIIK